jgi:hypothetical protein
VSEPRWYPTAGVEGRLLDFHESPRDVGMPELISSLVPSRQVALYENRGRVHNALLRTGRRFGLLAVSEALVGQLLDPRGSPSENRRWEYLESARQKLYEVTMWGSAREQVLLLVREPTVPLLFDSFHHRALTALRSAAGHEAFSPEEVTGLLQSDDAATRRLALFHLVPLLRVGPYDG